VNGPKVRRYPRRPGQSSPLITGASGRQRIGHPKPYPISLGSFAERRLAIGALRRLLVFAHWRNIMLRFIAAAAITITGILATTPVSAFHHHARWAGCGYGGCGYGYGGCGYGYGGYSYGGYGMSPYGRGYAGYGYRVYGPVASPMYYQPNIQPNIYPTSPYGYAVTQPSGASRQAANTLAVQGQGASNKPAPARAATPAPANASAPAPARVTPSTQLISTAQR
jgi:hypothetical protein